MLVPYPASWRLTVSLALGQGLEISPASSDRGRNIKDTAQKCPKFISFVSPSGRARLDKMHPVTLQISASHSFINCSQMWVQVKNVRTLQSWGGSYTFFKYLNTLSLSLCFIRFGTGTMVVQLARHSTSNRRPCGCIRRPPFWHGVRWCFAGRNISWLYILFILHEGIKGLQYIHMFTNGEVDGKTCLMLTW